MLRLIALLAAATTGCGGSVECAEGTFRDGDNCIGFDPNDTTPPVITLTPPASRTRDPIPSTVAVTTDENATIFFTTDGSDPDPTSPGEASPALLVDIVDRQTIKYFAIDRAGNQSALEMATYISDQAAPGKVTGLSVVTTATDATVTWTNPTDADFTGTVIARVADHIDGAPEPGTGYTAATALTGSLQILQVGAQTSFVDTGLPPGRVRYVAWTFDDLQNYSQPVAARSEIPLGNLELEYAFDTAANTLTLTPTPALQVTETHTLVGQQLTINLSIKNISTSFFSNPKLELVSQAGATFAPSPALTSIDGRLFADLGPATLAPSATVTKTVVFNSVAANATIRFKLGHHVSLIANRNNQREVQFFDSGTANALRETPRLTTLSLGAQGNRNKLRPPLAVGEHFIDAPTQHGSIERWDTVTQTRVAGIDVNAQNADRTNVQALVADSASVYAVLKAGKTRDSGKLTIVRYDEALRETGRVDLSLLDSQGFTHPAISPDGSTLAIPTGTQIALLDTTTLTLIDADPSTPAVDLITTELDTDRLRAVTYFSPTGLLAVGRSNGKAAAIRLSPTGPVVTLLDDAVTTNNRGQAVTLAPDGRVFVAFEVGLRVYDPLTDQLSPTSYVGGTQAVLNLNDQMRVLKFNKTQLDTVNPTTGAIQSTNAVGFSAIGHWLVTSR